MKYQKGFVLPLVIILMLLAGFGLYIYKYKTNNMERGSNTKKVSYEEACAKAGEFMLPGCASLVAIYNNDASICEKISLTPGNDAGSHNPEFKQSCKDVVETGTVVDKKFEKGGNVSFGQAQGIKLENRCASAVKTAGKTFLSYNSDGGKPWGKHSANSYAQADENGSILIETCSGF